MCERIDKDSQNNERKFEVLIANWTALSFLQVFAKPGCIGELKETHIVQRQRPILAIWVWTDSKAQCSKNGGTPKPSEIKM